MSETFGQRLARLRKEKGLTQEEVASRIVISPQAVSKWENGNSEPDISTLNQLADILGVSVDQLLGRENKETKNDTVVEEATEVKEEKECCKQKCEHRHRGAGKPFWITTSTLAGLCLIGYIVMGVLWTDKMMGWTVGWILLLLPIIVGSILNCIRDRRITHFAYPVLVVMVYVGLGLFGNYYGVNYWHPYWFLFLTIPAFYLIFGPVDKYLKSKYPKYDEDDDEEEEEK